jgi:uncharacterized membrane protein YcaP (DUF421 family)
LNKAALWNRQYFARRSDYLFLVLIVRVVGRRPGKQLTLFEFVLIFYLGDLTLTGMVGNEASLTNAICQTLTVARVMVASAS